MFYYTLVPTQWSPIKEYNLSNDVYLVPGGREGYENYPFINATSYFDNLIFITKSVNENEHIEKLKSWVVFHSFIFHQNIALNFFEDGKLNKHNFSKTLKEIKIKVTKPNAYSINFENISQQVYWLYKGSLPTITYNAYYERYLKLDDVFHSLILNYLLNLNSNTTVSHIYDIFSLHKRYWDTVKNIVLIEEIIGHALDCKTNLLNKCFECKRNNITQTHRKMSEYDWRYKYLLKTINNEKTVKEYIKIINTAFNKIRNPMAHSAISPTAKIIPQTKRLEIYDIDRTITEFKDNWTALLNLSILIENILRYLLLNKIFELNIFPIPKAMHAVHISNDNNQTNQNFTK